MTTPSQQKPRRASRARTESTAIRQALKAAGYEARVKHGTGTAASWIEATITGTWTDHEFRDQHYGKAYGIIKHTAGRDHLHDDLQTDLFLEKIMLDYAPRIPSDLEFATMPRERLEARADELRTDIHRIEGVGVNSGPRYAQLRGDLEATEKEIARRAEPAPLSLSRADAAELVREDPGAAREICRNCDPSWAGHCSECEHRTLYDGGSPATSCDVCTITEHGCTEEECPTRDPDPAPGPMRSPAQAPAPASPRPADLSCTLAELAREAIGESYMLLSEHGENAANIAVPILLNVVAGAVSESAGERANDAELQAFLLETTNIVHGWIKQGPGRSEIPPLPTAAIGAARIPLPVIAAQVVKAVSYAAMRSGEGGGDILKAMATAEIGRFAGRQMLGSLIAYLRGLPTLAEEIDGLLSDAAREAVEEIKGEIDRATPGHDDGLTPAQYMSAPAPGGMLGAGDCYRDHLDGYA